MAHTTSRVITQLQLRIKPSLALGFAGLLSLLLHLWLIYFADFSISARSRPLQDAPLIVSIQSSILETQISAEPDTPTPDATPNRKSRSGAGTPVKHQDVDLAPPAELPSSPAQNNEAANTNIAPNNSSVSAQTSDKPAPKLKLPTPLVLSFNVVSSLAPSSPTVGKLKWSHNDNRYDAELTIDGADAPQMIMLSSGKVTPEGLQPERFVQKLAGRPDVVADFGVSNLATTATAFQDPLSVAIQIAAIINSDPKRFDVVNAINVERLARLAPPPNTDRAVEPVPPIIRGTRFMLQPNQDISVPFANLRVKPALEQVVTGDAGVGDYLSMWLAPQLDYLPARMEIKVFHPSNANGQAQAPTVFELKLMQRP